MGRITWRWRRERPSRGTRISRRRRAPGQSIVSMTTARPAPAGAPRMSLPDLFLAFLRLGATAYGGPAMMAHLRADLVEQRRWIAAEEFTAGMALCQVIPGATMVQMSTYVGYRLHAVPGAVAAACGFILPSFLAMTALSALYFHSAALPVIRALFHGLSAVVVTIVLLACVRLWRSSVRGSQGLLIVILAVAALAWHAHFLLILVGAAGLALPLYGLSELRRPGREITNR
jgi:chromate transporter